MTSMFDEDKQEQFVKPDKALFDRALQLNKDKLVIAEDLKQLKSDFIYDEDMNPKGLPKEDVAEILAFAAKVAAENYEKVIETGKRFEELKGQFVG